MKRLSIILLFIIICNISTKLYSQSNQFSSSLYYKPPSEINGLTPVKVYVTCEIVNAFGTIQIQYQDKCTADLAYQYQGRIFTFTGSDAAVKKVVAKDPVVKVIVTGPNGFKKEMKLGFISGAGKFINSSDILNAKTPDEKNKSNYKVTFLDVLSVNYDNAWELQNELAEKIRDEKKVKELENILRKADNAMLMQNYIEAESLYGDANKLNPDNVYVKNQIAISKKKREQETSKKKFDDLMSSAKNAENEGNLSKAEKLYTEAAAGNVNKNVAENELERVKSLKAAKSLEIEKKKAKEQEEIERINKKIEESNTKKREETIKRLEEKDLEAKQLLTAKMDSIANSLDNIERKRLKEEQEKYWKEKEEQEKFENEKQKKEEKAENDLIKKENQELIEKYEVEMSYDPEMYYASIKNANELFQKALEINPWDELQLKREWWDNNSHIQYFADDLYENQRRENHQKYLKATTKAKASMYTAKYEFLNTLRFVDRNSTKHLSILEKIKHCDTHIKLYNVTWKTGFKSEGERIKQREQAVIMRESQIIIDNRQKAALAFSALDANASFSAEYLTQKYELAERMNVAHAKYVQAMAVTGVSQSVTMDLIANNDKTVDSGRVFGLTNTYAFSGYTSLPILLNETSDNDIPVTTINDLAVFDVNFGLDCWFVRTKNFDLNLGGYVGYGLYPSTSSSSALLNYGGKLNMDYGFKRFKITNTLEYIKRLGEMEVDYDIQSAENNFNIYSTNRKGIGNFDYDVIRLGAGIKIDLSDDWDASHILLNMFFEKPSFYMAESSILEFLKKPIYSFQAEFMSFSGFGLSIAYAKNYAIAGEKKYTISELVNKDFLQLRIFKYWTIFNPKKL